MAKVTIDVDLGTVGMDDVLGKLTDEHWRAIAEQAVLKLATDPKATEAAITNAMEREFKAASSKPPWMPDYKQSQWSREPELDDAKRDYRWSNEYQRRLSESPVARAVTEAMRRVDAIVDQRIKAVLASETDLPTYVNAAVSRLDVGELVLVAVQRMVASEVAARFAAFARGQKFEKDED